MTWIVFAIFAYAAFALDFGLRLLPVWSIHLGIGTVTPDLALILAVYFGLWASPRTTAWTFLVFGLVTDLLSFHFDTMAGVVHTQPGGLAIIGPNALGYLIGAYAIVQIRGLLYRESPLAMMMIVFSVGAVVNLVAVLLLTLRGLSFILGEPIANWNALHQLACRFLILLYSALLAAPLSLLFARFRGIWGLEGPKTKSGSSFRH